MATIEKRGRKFRIVFCVGGKKYSRSLKTDSERAANASLARLEDTLRRVELGTLSMPAESDLAIFLLSDGQQAERAPVRPSLTLKGLFDAYFSKLPEGSLEDDTISGMRIHERQLKKRLGAHFPIRTLTTTHLQDYIEKRSKDKGQRGRVTSITIRKAIVTLRTVWNWGRTHTLLEGQFPNNGLKYPKGKEKRPFMTYEEVERLSRGLTDAEQRELWECLFLTLPEVDELLKHVHGAARHPFVYPMFAFAAQPGARRAEILRSKVTDFDFVGNLVTIHERKKSHDKVTTRRVPMSGLLRETMQMWFQYHPGGEYTFCHLLGVERSKSKRLSIKPLTRHEAHDHFKRTLADSKWSRLRGFHVFRHSFCSNCAAKGVDQRIINAWVGHLSEQMVRRYRHLLPDQQQSAITTVFGGSTAFSCSTEG